MTTAAEQRKLSSVKRPFEAYLWDIHKHGIEALQFTQGKDLPELQRDDLLRSAVERCFSVIAEAVLQARLYYPDEPTQIEHAEAILALSEQLIENHDSDHSQRLWEITEFDLPMLVAEATVLLEEWHQG